MSSTTHGGTARATGRSRVGRVVTGSLLAVGLAATMTAGTYWTASAMQTALADAARTRLDAQQLTATVMMAGRDAYVWARTPTERADAIAAVRTVPGVRVVLVGDGAPPARGAVVGTAPASEVLPSDSAPVASATLLPAKATTPRPVTATSPGRTPTTHGPSITMTKEG